MTASTTITCTKSEFRANLRNHYATGVVIDKAQADELDEVIDGLVRQANEHRGTFEGYSAYLDCDFTVTPDEADELNAQRTLHLANAGQALPGDVIGVDARGEQRVIGEIIASGSGWEVFDADGSDWGYWGPTEALTVYRPS